MTRFDPWRFLGFLICVTSAAVTVAALWGIATFLLALEVGR